MVVVMENVTNVLGYGGMTNGMTEGMMILRTSMLMVLDRFTNVLGCGGMAKVMMILGCSMLSVRDVMIYVVVSCGSDWTSLVVLSNDMMRSLSFDRMATWGKLFRASGA